jgi:hypothetical protein
LGFITEQNLILAMLEWIAQQMMQIEAENKVGCGEGRKFQREADIFLEDHNQANGYSVGDLISFYSKTPQAWIHTVFHHGEEEIRTGIDRVDPRGIN